MKKIFFLLSISALLFCSCQEEEVVDVRGEQEPQGSAYFLTTDKGAGINPVEYTVEADATSYTYWLGRKNTTGSLTVNIVNHSDPRFTVPSTVTFESGADKAPLTISFESVPPENCLVSFEVEKSQAAIYSGCASFQGYLNCLWEALGTGYFFDYLPLFGSDYNVVEVDVFRSYVDPNQYKISDPYENADELLVDAWGSSYLGGDKNPDGIIFSVTDDENQNIVWNNYWNSGLIYTEDGNPSYTIRGWFPSALSSGYASEDEMSFYYPEMDVMIFFPHWYITGLGGFGTYPAILGMPSTYKSMDEFIPALEFLLSVL